MRTRRAVSEIIASMVVLIIVSSLGVMLYNISLSTFTSQQNDLLLDVALEEKIAQERFSIMGATRTVDNKMVITYINYGNIDVRITDVYLGADRYQVANPVISHKYELTSIVIKPNNFVLLPEKVLYKIRIVSEEGVTADASIPI